MSSTSHPPPAPPAGGSSAERTFFEQQRDALVSEIALSLEHVLMNINKLNRNLEGVLAVGKEFDSVEALWAQFEGVMARDGGEGEEEEEEEAEGEEEPDVTMREGGRG